MLDYIKLQEIAELKQALTIKELNTELLEHLQSSILFVMDYCEKNSVPLPNMNVIANSLERADQLMTLLRNNGKSTTENNNGGFNKVRKTVTSDRLYTYGTHRFKMTKLDEGYLIIEDEWYPIKK